jgi:hypothetical protein
MKEFHKIKDGIIIGVCYILYLATLMFAAYRTFQVSTLFFVSWCIFSPGLVLLFILNEKFKLIKYKKAIIPTEISTNESILSDGVEIFYVILAAFFCTIAFAISSFFI